MSTLFLLPSTTSNCLQIRSWFEDSTIDDVSIVADLEQYFLVALRLLSTYCGTIDVETGETWADRDARREAQVQLYGCYNSLLYAPVWRACGLLNQHW